MTKTNNPELPKKVKVAAFDIKVRTWGHREADALERFGQFSAVEGAIRINGELSPIKLIDTLLHEIGHAIYWAYGIEDEDKEERVVGTFATAWTQVYRDNPELLEFIKFKLGEKSEDT